MRSENSDANHGTKYCGGYDRIDILAAFGLFSATAAWAFLRAHPYPHPDLWPFLVVVQSEFGVTELGVAGRLSLGALAAFVYLDLRGFWFIHRDFGRDSPAAGRTDAQPTGG